LPPAELFSFLPFPNRGKIYLHHVRVKLKNIARVWAGWLCVLDVPFGVGPVELGMSVTSTRKHPKRSSIPPSDLDDPDV
jgi:hypothetical protein